MMMFYLQMIETEEDRSKFEKLYIEYRGLMYHVAFGILQHEEDTKDAVHQAFLNVVENIMKIEKAVSPKTKSYVVTIVENRALDIYRSRARCKEVPYNEEVMGLYVEYTGSDAIAHCLVKLPARYRELLTLKYRHGFSNKEIAKMLSITEANVRKLEQRSKERLFELCKEEGLL